MAILMFCKYKRPKNKKNLKGKSQNLLLLWAIMLDRKSCSLIHHLQKNDNIDLILLLANAMGGHSIFVSSSMWYLINKHGVSQPNWWSANGADTKHQQLGYCTMRTSPQEKQHLHFHVFHQAAKIIFLEKENIKNQVFDRLVTWTGPRRP